MDKDVIDSLNRSAKLFIDRGTVSTVEEAQDRLQAFRLHLFIGETAAASPSHQAALLTALNCGHRTFLGGVTVSGALQTPLASPMTPGRTLADAVQHLQGEIIEDIPDGVALVSVGEPPTLYPSGFAVRTTFQGWRGGLVPLNAPPLDESVEFTPSGALAGALAVAEVFAHYDGEAMAGYRSVGMSLWDQAASADWKSPASDGPAATKLPSDFWLIGLGHLGQAFLWTIGLLPFADSADVRMFLQDLDVAGQSTQSTSVLTFASDEGRLKTRICADWAEARGFRTKLIERRFASDFRIAHDEPLLALCGVDNPQARAILEGAGFATVFEAGLGSGVEDFRLIRTHSFPAPIKALEIWADEQGAENHVLDDDKRPAAYLDLRNRGTLDECGLTMLAKVAVGAPFVGMVAAAVLISQTIRMVSDGMRMAVFNLDVRAPQYRSLAWREKPDIVVYGTAASMENGIASTSVSD